MRFDYQWVAGTFVDRPNRFIAYFQTEHGVVKAHVPNTGRLRELLLPGTQALLSYHDDPKRKTQYELRMVHTGTTWVSIDSQLPNKVVEEGLTQGIIKDFGHFVHIKREYTYGKSRFDFFLSGDQDTLIEVKGVTLIENKWSYFPDAPTERGARHVEELAHAVTLGRSCGVVFLVQHPEAEGFTPNGKMDPAFAKAVAKAAAAGVVIVAWKCAVSPEGIELIKKIPIVLWEDSDEDTLHNKARKSSQRRI